ncbi:interferon regulatory factor 3-like isoform X2 [Eleutherodactylus coqui]|uniref:interferon regulatory factor 3-like isoform X2 n=1 Tax=Eleutherodactylus coqui TaxID=57060 RepID=UPI0034627210
MNTVEMGSKKPRIVPWLINQINSQEYPGLIWINEEHTQFRIPWKHGLRQDRSGDDVKIFEAWAIASHSYDPKKDTPNPAVWKRNVRAALNRKNEIRVITDNSSDSNEPHKIYEIIRGNIAGDDVASEDLNDSISPTAGTTNLNISGSQIAGDRYLTQGMTEISINDEGQVEYAAVETQESVHQNLLNQFFPNKNFETEFDVKIYYRGTLVKNTLVRNSNGFHITSNKQPTPESYLEEVTLPPPTAIHDQKKAAEIIKLLENLQLGTVVEVRDGAICAKRLGKCRSYWAMTDMPNTYQPNPINKTDYCILYNFQQFVKELIEFIEEKRKESPQYSIWICLGELWPDERSWKKKFIMVQITPISMQMLHELSYNTGASSLRSSEVNLQISDSLSLHSTSDLLTFLKEFEEKMDCA